MFGWSSPAAASASMRKRAMSIGLASRPARTSLRATIRPKRLLPGLVHQPHAALGDLFEQLVVAEVANLRPLGRRPGGGELQGVGPVIEAVVVGEEGAEVVGVFGVGVEQRLPARHLAGLGGLQVVGDDLVERTSGGGGVAHGGHPERRGQGARARRKRLTLIFSQPLTACFAGS